MLLPDFLNPAPTTHHKVLAQYQQRLEDLLRSGRCRPFVYPGQTLGASLLLIYLLLPPSNLNIFYYSRYPLFAAIVYFSVSAIKECRSSTVTVGYVGGLLNAWVILWSACLIIFNDARVDFKRIEEHEIEDRVLPNGSDQGITTALDGHALKSRQMDGDATESGERSNESASSNRSTFTWQGLPPTFIHRLDWVLDLITNFRGARWNYQISGLIPPPPHIHHSLKEPTPPQPNEQSHITRQDLIRRDVPTFILCYIALDALKYITLKDPYFLSLPPSTPSPFAYPRAARLVLSLLFVYSSLLTIFLLAPLVFAVLLGSENLGQHAWPWIYPPYFGSLSHARRKGLAGLWGGWWHQVFRYAFEQAGEFVGRRLGWSKKTQRGTMLRMAVAFACSGMLHACASYSTLGNTKPIRGSFAFFMMQPVGIIGQKAVSGWMKSVGLRDKIPPWLRGIGNVVVVVFWCYLVGPLIADEFAATGIWLYEPLPVSFFRGLSGQGWWCWGGRWVRWYSAERWWQSGFAF